MNFKRRSRQRVCGLLLLSVIGAVSCCTMPHCIDVESRLNRHDTTINYEQCEECKLAEVQRWQLAKKDFLGVFGQDLETDSIGIATVSKGSFGLDWAIPGWGSYSGTKMNFSGVLDSFYCPGGNMLFGPSEDDWNLMITPTGSSETIFEIGSDGYYKKYIKEKWGKEKMMEAELTPPEFFRDNNWFNKSKQQSKLIGRKIGVYGPCAIDLAHGASALGVHYPGFMGKKPEIHPINLLWWLGDTLNSTQEWYFLNTQDVSERFSDQKNYKTPNSAVWAKSPALGQFSIATEWIPNGKSCKYFVNAEEDSNVVERYSIMERNFSLKILNGVFPNVDVVFDLKTAKSIGVGVHGVCKYKEKLIGYLDLSSKVGCCPEKPGFQLFRVSNRGFNTEVRRASDTNSKMQIKIQIIPDPETVRFTKDDPNRTQIILDVQCLFQSSSLPFKAFVIADGILMPVAIKPTQTGCLVVGVPLSKTSNDSLAICFNKDTLIYQIPKLSLGAAVDMEAEDLNSISLLDVLPIFNRINTPKNIPTEIVDDFISNAKPTSCNVSIRIKPFYFFDLPLEEYDESAIKMSNEITHYISAITAPKTAFEITGKLRTLGNKFSFLGTPDGVFEEQLVPYDEEKFSVKSGLLGRLPVGREFICSIKDQIGMESEIKVNVFNFRIKYKNPSRLSQMLQQYFYSQAQDSSGVPRKCQSPELLVENITWYHNLVLSNLASGLFNSSPEQDCLDVEALLELVEKGSTWDWK